MWDAQAFGPMCTQDLLGLNLPELVFGQEDCVFLNVFVPALARPNSELPVIVWLFGGTFADGDGHDFGWYDNTHLAKQHNVIIVTLNYRVGVFGFMVLPELMEESGTVGNQALQDQRMAMLFVHRNILQFGGSLDKVMVFGQSAGAMIVCYHYATTASRGLFSAAIMQSGTCDISGLFQKLATPSNFTTAYAVGLGCDQPPGQARLSCLQNLQPWTCSSIHQMARRRRKISCRMCHC